jgi:hypothetical protein
MKFFIGIQLSRIDNAAGPLWSYALVKSLPQIARCGAGVLCLGSSLPAFAPVAIGAIHQTAINFG